MVARQFRIYLRALELEDYKVTVMWRRDPGYQAGVGSTKRFISSETERKWIESAIVNHEQGKSVRLGVVLKETDELIGMISLVDIDYINKSASVASWIGMPDHRGKGYIGEARYLAFKYAFEELGLERIAAQILESNQASRRSCEKFGYQQEGMLRRAVFKGGQFHNMMLYSFLKDEFYDKYNSD